MIEPTGSDAAASLSEAERIAVRVRSRTSQNLVAWLVSTAVASTFYLTGVGIAGDDWVGITALSGVLGVSIVSVTAVFLSRLVVGSPAQMRRWRRTVLIWMLVFGAALAVGLPLFPGQLWFWVPVAIVVALPLTVGAVLESRA